MIAAMVGLDTRETMDIAFGDACDTVVQLIDSLMKSVETNAKVLCLNFEKQSKLFLKYEKTN